MEKRLGGKLLISQNNVSISQEGSLTCLIGSFFFFFFLYVPHYLSFPLSDEEFVPLLREKQCLEKHESYILV